MFVASTLIGFTVMQRYPKMKVVVAHGKASWMEEVLEKMEASTRVIPLLHTYPVRTDPEEMWEEGHVMLGFDAEERLIQKLPHDFAAKVVWGSRYPHHDTTSAWDAIAMLTQANVEESLMARMMGERRPAVWHCAGPDGWRLAIRLQIAYGRTTLTPSRGTQAPGAFSGSVPHLRHLLHFGRHRVHYAAGWRWRAHDQHRLRAPGHVGRTRRVLRKFKRYFAPTRLRRTCDSASNAAPPAPDTN